MMLTLVRGLRTLQELANHSQQNKTLTLNQNLTCANYGIYVATSVIYAISSIGQTVRNVSTR